ncbi:MAG: hypothetical protein JW774_11005 [Candidatus Aureabacteria bacterium]|nr:hypothetical protein [Candidatus Auribacterota bacterium]
MNQKTRDQIEIILVGPEEPGNIGAAARAMHNTGFFKLGLVNPVEYKVPDAWRMAWGSKEILEKASVYPDIPSAVSGKGYVVAMSKRSSKDRGHFELLNDFVQEIHQVALKTKVAILFGRESCGLLNEEILYANRCVRIHTAGHFSSLNLAQAVLITCYELLCSDDVKADDRPLPATHQHLEQCYEHISTVLWKIGYGERGERLLPENIVRVIRQLAGRALPDEREVKMIRGLCSQVEKITDKGKKNRS